MIGNTRRRRLPARELCAVARLCGAILAAAAGPSAAIAGDAIGHLVGSAPAGVRQGPAAPRAARLVWRRALLADGSDLTAVAVDTERDRLALGDAEGVLLRADGRLRRVTRRGPVRDLAFLAGGDLLVATERGLFRADAEGRVEDRSPAPGEAARDVRRIAVAGSLVAVATGDGVHVSAGAARWQQVRGALPSGAADAVALRAQPGGAELWMALSGEVWRVALRIDTAVAHAPLSVGRPVREAPFDGGVRRALDVAAGLPGADALVLARDALAAYDAASGRWRTLRPSLSPGAVLVRSAFAAGRFWLATDQGLLEAEQLAGPWRRAAPPAGSAPTRALVGLDGAVYAATRAGLLEARAMAAAPAATAGGAIARDRSELPADPPIHQVHRAALAALDLGPGRMRALRRGVDRRGLLPVATLRLSADRSRDRGHDFDESFVSGATRRLHDRDRDRKSSYEISLALTWDLGDAAYHPEAIDVSREAREVLELRDDVLDEITQLYFERRRVLFDLAALDPAQAAEAHRLRLRAGELAAGLDAWTGGWFGRAAEVDGPGHPVE